MIVRLVSLFGFSFLTLLVGKGGSVLGRVVLVREMAQSDFGIFTVVFAAIPLFATIGLLGMHKGLVRELPMLMACEDHAGIRSIVIFVLVSSLASCSLISVALFGLQIGLGFVIFPHLEPSQLLLVCLTIPGYALVIFASHLFWATGSGKLYLLGEQSSFPLVFMALIVGLALQQAMSLGEVLAAYLAASWGVGLALAIFALIKIGRQHTSGVSARTRWFVFHGPFLAYSMTLLLSAASYVALGAIDRLLLANMVKSEDIALYGVAYTIAALVPILLVMVDALATPQISSAFAKKDIGALQSAYVETNRNMLVLATPACLGLAVLHPWVLTVFGDAYVAAGSILLILLLGEYLNVLFGVSGRVLQVGGQEKFEAVLVAAVVIGNVLLNLALIPAFGVLGAAIATAATRVLHGAAKAFRVRNVWEVGFWWDRTYR